MSTTSTPVALDDADLPFLDLQSPEYEKDPWAVMAALRASDPRGGHLFRSFRGIEVMDYDQGREILKDRRLEVLSAPDWSDSGAGPLLVQFMTDGKMTSLSGDKHLRLRRMLGTPFRVGTIQEQEPLYRAIANELVDGFIERGECDLVADFSHRYPIIVLCRAIGVPVEDVPVFENATLDLGLVNSIPLAPVADRVEAALQSLWDYATPLLAERRANPRDDFVTELAQRESDGELTHAELVWGFVNLLFGAHDTTRYMTASIVRALLEEGAWDEVAANPELVPGAVEEGLRYYPVTPVITRRVVEEGVVIDGVELPPGTVMRFNVTGATREPGRFEHPDAFDVHREATNRIPFGFGLHKCLGHTMARADMEVALEVLTQRLKNPRIVGPVETKLTGQLWGVNVLPLAFDPGPRVGA